MLSPQVCRAVLSRFRSAVVAPGGIVTKGAIYAAVGVIVSMAKLHAAIDANATAAQYCYSCHGDQFTGGRVAALAGGAWHRAHSDEEAVQTILNGLPQAGMPSFQKALSADDARAIVAFIHRQETLWEPKQTVHSGDLIQTQRGTFKLELFATGFENPWSFAFLPDGKVILTEKAGRLRILDHGKLTPRIKDIPRVHYQQDGGLLSLALDPDYAQSGWIYLSFSDRGEKWGTSMTKIIRGKIRDGHWVEQQTIWAADQKFYYSGDDHYGCRLLFVQGKLFFTIGDRGNRNTPQDLSNPCGKIHRVNPNGTVPSDNPFVGRKDADPTVWSYGHRNPQGLAVDQQTGELWEVEHGPKGGDELNHIRKGGNYGWPLVTYGRNEDGTKISDVTNGAPGMLDPIAQWTPSLAPGVLYYSNSDRYPGWKNQFLVGFLHGQQLHRVEVKGDTLIDEEAFLNTIGRVRDIETGPDGLIYIAVEHWDQPGSIWRLVPVEK